ncbi:MAG: twin-arginine translocase subunit TatC [Terrimonas sp.]|nr:twin-arginine translocase subunit TatC [Terrimonas sp.]
MALKFFNRRRGPAEERAEMSFIDHLEELRSHLFRSIIAIAIGGVVIGIYNKFVVRDVLMGPTHPDFITYRLLCKAGYKMGLGDMMCITEIPVKMQNTFMSGQLTLLLNVILIGGFILAFPYVFWQFWKFIKPALTDREKQRTKGVIFWVSFLFFLGIVFGYFVIAPYTVNFLSTFTLDENIQNIWTITSYLDTMTPLIMGTGLAFQLPLVIYFLAKIGIVSPAFLRRYRRHAIVIILIIAAFITPPDVISQCIVSLPLLLLYEISIKLAVKVEKQNKKDETAEWS